MMAGAESKSVYYLVSPCTSPVKTNSKSNLSKSKSRSLYKLYERWELQRFFTFVNQFHLPSAASKISLQLPTRKDLIQKIFPADFSQKTITKHEDFNQGRWKNWIFMSYVFICFLFFFYKKFTFSLFQFGSKCTFMCINWRTLSLDSITLASRYLDESSPTAVTRGLWDTSPGGVSGVTFLEQSVLETFVWLFNSWSSSWRRWVERGSPALTMMWWRTLATYFLR